MKSQIIEALSEIALTSGLATVAAELSGSNNPTKEIVQVVDETFEANSFTESEVDNGFESVKEACIDAFKLKVKNAL